MCHNYDNIADWDREAKTPVRGSKVFRMTKCFDGRDVNKCHYECRMYRLDYAVEHVNTAATIEEMTRITLT